MKVLVSWLRELVDIAASPEEIAETMSVRGFAVEGIESVRGSGLISGEVRAETRPDPLTDFVLDFEITANRPDAMSMIGIAREVATAYGLTLKSAVGSPQPAAGSRQSADADSKTAERSPREIDITLDNPDLCPRYVGALADVTVGPSPGWMQLRLQAAGIRPISNIVDITNYVLLELGQPMHAFDYATIAKRQIRVRTAKPGETLKTLDGEVRELSTEMLVIADAERASAIAGVMGGADSEVTATTKTILFESAYFNPLSVRRTSKALGLKTEASMRFERGADPHLPRVAMERALELLEQTGAGTPRGAILDACRTPFGLEPVTIVLRRIKIARLLGAFIQDGDIERILSSLGFTLVRVEEGWRVSVPTRRVDVLREVDLIEEVARHYGLDRLPSTFPSVHAAPPPSDPRLAQARQLRALLTAAGFFEAVTFGFISEDLAAPYAAAGDLVPIANPLSENFAVLRPSSLPGLVEALAHNRRRQQHDIRLFEIGNRFTRRGGERRAVACAWTGAGSVEHWSGAARAVDFFDIKGLVQRLAEALRLEAHSEAHTEPWLAPGRSAALIAGGARVGVLGQLAPAVAERHGLSAAEVVYVAEIDLDAAEPANRGAEMTVEPLPRFPSINRDISILVDDTLAAEAVRRTIEQAAPATLVRVREFDRYQGKGVPEGKVSLSLRLTYRSPDRTLTDAEVQSAMDAILTALKAQHAAVQR